MTLLGIELSDAGILAAGGSPPRLLDTEGTEKESPGYALSTNGQLITGKDARNRARLNPRAYSNRFWDELNTESIRQPGLEGTSNAELAYLHLSKLWGTLKKTGDEVALAIPGSYTEAQLGLLLGITNALSIPIKGFVPIALAGSQASYPQQLFFHLDIHLHRIEITLLKQGDRLQQGEVKTLYGRGLSYLSSDWVKLIADEFVRTTRFDPFDQAVYEQEVHNRLPSVLADLQSHASATITIQGKSQNYQVPLTYDLFAQKGEAVFLEARRLMEDMVSSSGLQERPTLLQVTHRVSPLPGWREVFSAIPALTIAELAPGAAALGALTLRDRFSSQSSSPAVIFITSIPARTSQENPDAAVALPGSSDAIPTHILFKNHAYPITSSPLTIGSKDNGEITLCTTLLPPSGHTRTYCTIEVRGNDVILLNHAAEGTLVDGETVVTTSTLRLGQTIRAGTHAEEFKLIACVATHEKEKRNRI